MTRQQKTPQQRAQEALDVEKRRVSRLTEQWSSARADFEHLSKERDAAIIRRDYLAQHPDLKPQIPTTQGETAP